MGNPANALQARNLLGAPSRLQLQLCIRSIDPVQVVGLVAAMAAVASATVAVLVYWWMRERMRRASAARLARHGQVKLFKAQMAALSKQVRRSECTCPKPAPRPAPAPAGRAAVGALLSSQLAHHDAARRSGPPSRRGWKSCAA